MKKLIYTHEGDGNGHAAGLVLTWETVKGAGALAGLLGVVVALTINWNPKAVEARANAKIEALSARLEAEARLTDERFVSNANTRNLLMEQINKRFDGIETKLDQILRERRR